VVIDQNRLWAEKSIPLTAPWRRAISFLPCDCELYRDAWGDVLRLSIAYRLTFAKMAGFG
jgi:hypothetical protein